MSGVEKKAPAKALKAVGIVLLCVLLNIAGRAISEQLNLPIWLDFLGTFTAVFLTGPVGGASAGVAANLIMGIFMPSAMPYAIVSALTAVFFWLFIRKKCILTHTPSVMVISSLCGVFAAMASLPLNILLSDGYPNNFWADAVFNFLSVRGWDVLPASLLSELAIDVIDKQICALLAFFIVRYISYKTHKIERIQLRTIGFSSLISMLFILPILFFGVHLSRSTELPILYNKDRLPVEAAVTENAIDKYHSNPANYKAVLYNRDSGAISSEANQIAETADGFVWIGGYAGLSRYDGNNFKFYSDSGISNITAFFTDREGRLWIGTNDKGVILYNEEKFTFYTPDSSLMADSVRFISQTNDGTIYILTTGPLCKIDENGKVVKCEIDAVNYASMDSIGNSLGIVTKDGKFQLIRDDVIIEEYTTGDENVKFTTLEVSGNIVFLGTTENVIRKISIENDKITELEHYSTKDVVAINYIEYEKNGDIMFTSTDGFGIIDSEGRARTRFIDGYHSIGVIHQDYQGNLWLTSTRYGVMKLSENNFLNVSSLCGAEKVSVNGIACVENLYYCATDSGLVILNRYDNTIVTNELTKQLEGVRIRAVNTDSKSNIWLSTYGEDGLVCYSLGGDITCYNEGNGTTVSKFRTMCELSDGSIAGGTAGGGINFINNGKVVGTLTADDGLENTTMLCLTNYGEKLYAGTDGAGIYVIENGKIVDNITKEDGLTSNVVMRVVPYEEGGRSGFFAVTGNALCYIENGKAQQIESFPYYNNYDVIIMDGVAYVLTSSGMYSVAANDLRDDNAGGYEFYGADVGLSEGLVANSWSTVDGTTLLICSNAGVITYNTTNKRDIKTNYYKAGLLNVSANGNSIAYVGDKYTVPAGDVTLEISPSIRNYTTENVKLRFYIEGMGGSDEIVTQKNLENLRVSNLGYGVYRIVMEIMDNSGSEITQEFNYTLEKLALTWERDWFIFYPVVIIMWQVLFIAFIILLYFVALQHRLRKKDQQFISEIIETFTGFIDAKDPYTAGHSARVAEYSKMIAKELGYGDQLCKDLYYCAMLHDAGKIGIPDAVLKKPGKLDSEEFSVMKSHTSIGAEILKKVTTFPDAAIAAQYHHEKFDGTGYPNKVAGDSIPKIGRIVCVADAFDAMSTNRCYRKKLSRSYIEEELKKCSGSQFDPKVVEAILKLIDNGKIVIDESADE